MAEIGTPSLRSRIVPTKTTLPPMSLRPRLSLASSAAVSKACFWTRIMGQYCASARQTSIAEQVVEKFLPRLSNFLECLSRQAKAPQGIVGGLRIIENSFHIGIYFWRVPGPSY